MCVHLTRACMHMLSHGLTKTNTSGSSDATTASRSCNGSTSRLSDVANGPAATNMVKANKTETPSPVQAQ